MRATEEGVRIALRTLRGHSPGEYADVDSEATVQLWLTTFERWDDGVLRDAAIAWSGDKFPNTNQFYAACQAVAQARAAEAVGRRALQDAERHADADRALPPEVNAAMASWLDARIRERQESAPPHSQPHSEACPRCLSSDGWQRRLEADAEEELARLMTEAGLVYGEPKRTAECGLCDGSGWREVSVIGGHRAVRPCRCRQPRERADHGPRCSCGRCHYGAERWAKILAGRDGATDARGEPDPLLVSNQDELL